jgi:hypothetical protein
VRRPTTDDAAGTGLPGGLSSGAVAGNLARRAVNGDLASGALDDVTEDDFSGDDVTGDDVGASPAARATGEGGTRHHNKVATPSITPTTSSAARPMAGSFRLLRLLCGARVGGAAAADRIRRVISDAGSGTAARNTGSGGTASKARIAASRAPGRAAAFVERPEVRTSTSLGSVPGLNVVSRGRVSAVAGAAPVRQNQPMAARA